MIYDVGSHVTRYVVLALMFGDMRRWLSCYVIYELAPMLRDMWSCLSYSVICDVGPHVRDM